MHPSKNLSDNNLGPFEIIAHPGTHSFMLQLPDSMKSVHPVFHVSQLETSTLNTIPNHTLTPPPLIKTNREVKYEIAEVLNLKINC